MKKMLILLCVFIVGTLSARASEAAMLQIKGSDTLINAVQKLAEVYMQENPGKYIAVTGGGSGTGIAALINRKCDIANSSRDIKPKEVEQALNAGVEPKRVVIGIDGVSVVVNAKNPVTKLTMDELGKIFRGEIKNWSEVGGQNMPINLYGRQSNSGTYVFFMEVVLKGDYSPKMRNINGNAQIIEAIKTDVSGIGYVGVSYAKDAAGVNILLVSAGPGAPYASPLHIDEVNSGAYPVARTLNQYISSNAGKEVRDFVAFELSPQGQAIVAEQGFYQVPPDYQEYNKRLGF